jgi:L-amino acid N-acyltransferase YncA
MNTEIVVEPMTEADWPAVAAIHWEGISTGDATFTAEPAATFTEFMGSKLACGALVARDRLAGVCGWTILSRVSTRPVYAGVAEVGIYISAAMRGRGIGTLLLRELITRSETAGVWTLQAAIFPENIASLALHLRHGFREVGRRERVGKMTFGPRAGEWRDTLLLERRSPVVN